MTEMAFKKFRSYKIIIALFVCLAVTNPIAYAVVIEPDPDLQRIMGDLYSLSVAMRLYYDDTHKKVCPTLDELAHYLKGPLPVGWPADYRTATVRGDWWVGRKAPDCSTARKFLRDNAPSLGLYDQEAQSAWLGGAFVWMSAVPSDFKVAQGDGGDNQYLFFNSPGTDYYWRGGFIYTTQAHAEVLKKFGTDAKGPFVMPPPPSRPQEVISASPVTPPPDFTLGRAEDEEELLNMGDVIFNNPAHRRKDW